MTDHCTCRPFSACLSCQYQGGTNPAAGQGDSRGRQDDNRTLVWEDGGSETAPAGALTPVAPGPDHRLNSRQHQEDSVASPEPTLSPTPARQNGSAR